MKLYVVTENGYNGGYGSRIYLKGVFDSLEKAQEIVGDITEVDLNEKYPLKDDEWYGYSNDLYLGGYIE